ncbi:hypothetical protein L21SP5_03432 [Salinivirga cyanobacteriivorans]|uniref:Haem-binding uptake Tiki superfamily ChaN domain-containing protein n=1 Tax=Salinivirga cyanobacteriivorans TaxID=1307839 RepID=A0A0S2I3S5_9BACT|nr:hypothetical protein [Salinivirga cyanobacteriivorans]ALO17043.1 hypothetical protein L21SP5_03432 [Salinivirga cyanobacteriivorans]
MNNKITVPLRFVYVLIVVLFLFSCKNQKTEVTVCGTLHGYHKKNPEYSYQSLYQFIETYNPDVIGVEIRTEDINSTFNFLSNYYPREMVEAANRFSDRKIYGVDWWNADIAGLKMSDEIISNVPNIAWERAYQADTIFLKRKPNIIDELFKKKIAIVADASINEIVMGDYDSLNFRYYTELGNFLINSPHEQLYRSYMERHEMIAQRMVNVVNENPGKKIMFLTGADHQVYAKMKLKDAFGSQIQLNAAFQ